MSGTPQRNPTHQQPHHADDSSTPHAHVVPSSHYGHPTLPPSTPLTHPTNNTPPQTEWKRGRPKQARPLPSPALTPIPSSTPSVPRRVRTSQIVHKYVEHVARAPPVPPPPPIPTCNVCYSTDIRLYTAPEIEERRANPVEPAMRVARAYGLPFGNFMMKLLDPSKTYILNQTATATQLGRFLKGRAVVTPVDMVEAMRVHPYSVPHATNGSVIHPSTTNAPSSSVPPSSSAAYCHNPTPNNHGSDGPEPREADDEDGVGGPDDGGTSSPFAFHALDEWAAHRTRVRVQREVRSLATLEMLRAVTTQETLSWSALLSFSIAPISAAILQAAPVLWSIMTAAAVPKSATNGRIEGDHSEGWPTDSKGRRKTTRDPWLVSSPCPLSFTTTIANSHDARAASSPFFSYFSSTITAATSSKVSLAFSSSAATVIALFTPFWADLVSPSLTQPPSPGSTPSPHLLPTPYGESATWHLATPTHVSSRSSMITSINESRLGAPSSAQRIQWKVGPQPLSSFSKMSLITLSIPRISIADEVLGNAAILPPASFASLSKQVTTTCPTSPWLPSSVSLPPMSHPSDNTPPSFITYIPYASQRSDCRPDGKPKSIPSPLPTLTRPLRRVTKLCFMTS